ncbi:MAG: hypothetical protein RR048_00735 [Oscillospiraceae bacterium]
MTYKISKIKNDEANFEAIPVFKIIDYPLEKRDYKPYAQARVAVGKKYFHIQLLSFEVAPKKESAVEVVMNFFPDEYNKSIYVAIKGDKTLCYGACNDGCIENFPLDIRAHFYDGEDLQGIYWGADLRISLMSIEELYGKDSIGDDFVGNIYKTCNAKPHQHYGSLFPTDWQSGYLSQSNFGKFTIINY